MNYQMLLECYAAGISITKQEVKLLDLELESQITSIQYSRTEGCIKTAPDHICKAANLSKNSLWITCLATVLDKIIPVAIGKKSRGETAITELVRNGYIET